jgi:cell wall-associated NlpC family hydrolase
MSFPSFTRSRQSRVAVVLGTAALVCLPAIARAQDAKPFQAYSNSAQSLRDSIVTLAKAQLGTRYRYGGKTPEHGFDCSGLVQYVMAALHLDVPRTARQQAKTGLAVVRDTSHLLPGDLLTFAKPKRGVSHVGIYIGDGQFIQASSVAGRVVVSPLDRPTSRLIKAWRGARRVLALDDSATSAAATAVVAPAPAPPTNTRGGGSHHQ